MRKMSEIVRNQDPVTLRPSATVREACQRMRDRRVGAVLVTDGDRRLAGIFTARDAVHRVLAEGRNAAHTALAEVMTPDPDTIPAGKMAIEAAKKRFARLEGIRDWKIHAALIEIETIEVEVKPPAPTPAREKTSPPHK